MEELLQPVVGTNDHRWRATSRVPEVAEEEARPTSAGRYAACVLVIRRSGGNEMNSSGSPEVPALIEPQTTSHGVGTFFIVLRHACEEPPCRHARPPWVLSER